MLLLILAVAPACHPMYWTKPGFNAADWQRDNYECERDARMSVLSFGTGIAGSINEQGFYNRCLMAHGYDQVDARQPAVTAAQSGGSPAVIGCDADLQCDLKHRG